MHGAMLQSPIFMHKPLTSPLNLDLNTTHHVQRPDHSPLPQ
jgi:hypothetical protein